MGAEEKNIQSGQSWTSLTSILYKKKKSVSDLGLRIFYIPVPVARPYLIWMVGAIAKYSDTFAKTVVSAYAFLKLLNVLF